MANNLISSNARIPIRGEFPPVATFCGKGAVLALVIASLAYFVFFARALLLKYPPVWPDEAWFAEPAINLLRHGTMQTTVLAGVLPGIGQHTYWMPPLHFLYVAGVFRFTGPGLGPLRLASMAAALAVMALVYLLALRTGLGRWLSLLPLSLVAFDAVFLRGALVGRMDMLALALMLLSLCLAMTAFRTTTTPSHLLLTGIVCGLAVLAHPMGAAAPFSVGVSSLLWRESRTRRFLFPLLAGISIPFLSWLVYILHDAASFVAQFGVQLAEKYNQYSTPDFPLDPLIMYMGQYGFPGARLIDALGILPVWVAGLIGLGYSLHLAFRSSDRFARQCFFLLCIFQASVFAVVLWSAEFNYAIYVIPITAIGLCHLLKRLVASGPFRWSAAACASLVIISTVWFVTSNLRHLRRLNYLENVAYKSETDYGVWCAEIGRKIPSGSKLLLDVIPDPYFGLMNRSDLSFHEYLPEKVPIEHETYWRYMSQADYIVVGGRTRSPSLDVEEFVKSNATLVDTVGKENRYYGYAARIYRVNKRDDPR